MTRQAGSTENLHVSFDQASEIAAEWPLRFKVSLGVFCKALTDHDFSQPSISLSLVQMMTEVKTQIFHGRAWLSPVADALFFICKASSRFLRAAE